MNSVCLIGNLCKDVVCTTTSRGTKMSSNDIAIKDFNGETTFVPFKVFGKSVDILARCKKGQKIGISGSLKSGSYKRKDGTKVYTLDVFVSDIQFLNTTGKEADPIDDTNEQQYSQEFATNVSGNNGFSSEDIPF